MKKTLIFLMTALLATMLVVSCDDNKNGSSAVFYKVTFDSREGTAVPTQTVKEGEKATKPSDVTRDGYEFIKWTTDEAGKVEYNFDTPVTADIALYAQWKKVYAKYALGPAGGIIFYDKGSYSDDWRYLEVGLKDLSGTYQWGTTVVAGLGEGIGDGKKNTETLAGKGSDYAAATAVWEKDVYSNEFKDWFLPSKGELGELYNENAAILEKTISASIEYYSIATPNHWSSSSYGSSYVFMQKNDKYAALAMTTNLTTALSVRPIRRF